MAWPEARRCFVLRILFTIYSKPNSFTPHTHMAARSYPRGHVRPSQQSTYGSYLYDRLAVVLEAVHRLATEGHQPRAILCGDPRGGADAIEQLSDAAVRVRDRVVAENHIAVVLGALLLPVP
jgi:hypothetical protein